MKARVVLLLFAFYSTLAYGQEADTLKAQTNVLETLEFETTLSVFEHQNFNSIPGGGVNLKLVAPIYHGGLRIGFGVGFGQWTVNYEFRRTLSPTGVPYSAQLDIQGFNMDFMLGTDFLRKSKFDLTLDIGSRLLIPLSTEYHFEYPWYSYGDMHSFELASSILPSLFGQLSLKIPFSEQSSFSISYGFGYIFEAFRLHENSSSNGVYYQPDFLSDDRNRQQEGYLVALITEPGIAYLDGVSLKKPATIGGQHSISIGYRHTFGLKPKSKD